MKRPLALFCITVITATTVALLFLPGVPLFIAGLSLVAAAFIAARRKEPFVGRVLTVLMAIVMSLSVFAVRQADFENKRNVFKGDGIPIDITVAAAEKRAEKYYLISGTASYRGVKVNIEFASHEYIPAGISASAVANVDGLNEKSGSFELKDVAILSYKEESGVLTAIRSFKESAAETIKRSIGGKEGGLAAGITLGDKSGLSAEEKNNFVLCGTSHVLVVSGLHVSVLSYFLVALLKKLRVPYPAIGVSVVLLCLFMLVLMDFSVSIVRVSIMTSLVYAAGGLRRKSDSATTLSLAAALILLCDGYAVYDGGFWLSFVSTFALSVAVPPIAKRVKGAPRWFRGPLKAIALSLVSTTVISVLLIPVEAVLGMPVSLVSPIANLAVVWLTSPAVLLSVLAAVLYAAAPAGALTLLFASAAKFILKMVLYINNALASLPLPAVSTGDRPVFVIIIGLAVGLLLWLMLRKRIKFKAVMVGGAAAAVVISVVVIRYWGASKIVAFNYGQGLNVALCSSGTDLFVTNDSDYCLEQTRLMLKLSGVTPDYSVGIGAHPLNGARQVIDLEKLQNNTPERIFLSQGDELIFSNGEWFAAATVNGVKVYMLFGSEQMPDKAMDAGVIVAAKLSENPFARDGIIVLGEEKSGFDAAVPLYRTKTVYILRNGDKVW